VETTDTKAVETRKYLSESELKSLLKAISDPRDKAIFTLAYWRGLRASEVGKLTISAYDARAGRLHVKRLKRSLEGTFLLSPGELRAMRAWIAIRGTKPGALFPSRHGRGISRQMLDVLMRRYGALAGVPPDLRHFHSLKHSIGTHLIAKIGVENVQKWLGHRDIKSTLVYAQMRDAQLDEAARRVYEG
jgi:type 1 fimbriae regulatory protein FimB